MSPRPSQGVGDPSTHARILTAATGMFTRRGYDGTSLAQIAKEVGISTPALYWHFDSKEDLFVTAMEEILVDFTGSVESVIGDGTPTERLSAFCRAHVLWQLERREDAKAYAASLGFRELVASLPDEARRRVMDRQRNYNLLLRQILCDGQAAEVFRFTDARVTTFAIITLCDYVFTWYDPSGELSPAQVADLYCELVLDMVGVSNR